MRIYKFYLLLIILCLTCFKQGYSQCTADINTFPYNEGFENNTGHWTTINFKNKKFCIAFVAGWLKQCNISCYNSGNLLGVKVSDENGCTVSDTINVNTDCINIYFPSAFTPNGDGLNDTFGPWGSLQLLKNYSLTVYGRWGEIVFQSTNPYKKWNGKLKGRDFSTGTFVWVATYSFNGSALQTKKGTVIILY